LLGKSLSKREKNRVTSTEKPGRKKTNTARCKSLDCVKKWKRGGVLKFGKERKRDVPSHDEMGRKKEGGGNVPRKWWGVDFKI